ncbi:MAG: magnesium transporter [Erysipelotrichaceae bacterium]|nr:magnesium transporter [Erysipelotrichaceae bacterium]MBP5280092.1 magnesium transporter [Erysipelotrichaceae bacterium]
MEEKVLEENIEERNYTQEIFDLIRKTKNSKLLAQTLTNYHDNDIADALTYLSPEERKRLYKAIGVEATSRIFAYLTEDVDKYFAELENEKAADILEEMDVDDAIDILEGLDKKKADEIINLIEPESKSDIQLIKSYKDNEFGSLMTTNFITLEYGIGIKKSIAKLIEEAEENDNIETLYIVKDGKFYGALTLRDLLITKKDEDLDDKIILSYPFVYDREEITEAAIDTLTDYSEDSIPVLNKDTNQIVGVITSADLVELINDEEEKKEVIEEKEIKKVNYLELIAFILVLLVAVNRIFNLVPSVTYVEIGLIILAIALEAYNYFTVKKV